MARFYNSGAAVAKHPEWEKKTKERLLELREKDAKTIKVTEPIIRTNLITRWSRRPEQEKPEDFDWSMYEDGWNGRSLKINKNVKVNNPKDKVYCHEAYAQEVYDKLCSGKAPVSKELTKNALVNITDLEPVNANTVMATINNGETNIIIDLDKEQKFMSTIAVGGQTLNKASFIECLGIPQLKQQILGMDLYAKVGTDTEKASIWDGYVAKITQEMADQVTANNKAYIATILSTNKGGFVVEIMGVVKAFMPGSMAAKNRVTDYESMVGQSLEVMVESYDKNIGFVVSRKKYLNTILPIKLKELAKQLKKNQDMAFTGHVTDYTPYGVFVEIDEFITGMMHKSLVSDETREAMRNNAIKPGDEYKVYIHKIENNRVILSDVPSSERDAVIARREAEDEAEKAQQKKEETK